MAAGEPPVPPAGADSAAPPYRALERFQPEDRALFFGRDDLIAQFVDKVRHFRLVAVVGASGSGKSSLLRAGLIPALRETPDRSPSGTGSQDLGLLVAPMDPAAVRQAVVRTCSCVVACRAVLPQPGGWEVPPRAPGYGALVPGGTVLGVRRVPFCCGGAQ